MRTVVTTLRAAELSDRMSKMRLWLDGQRSEPASFTYEQNGEEVIVRVGFSDAEKARAFKVQFDGPAALVISAGARAR
jgi:hypothetical protein